MTFSIHGLAVARGIAIGRAVLVASSRVPTTSYSLIKLTQKLAVCEQPAMPLSKS
jgi:phosphotransferase system enzyme I (PtsI)